MDIGILVVAATGLAVCVVIYVLQLTRMPVPTRVTYRLGPCAACEYHRERDAWNVRKYH